EGKRIGIAAGGCGHDQDLPRTAAGGQRGGPRGCARLHQGGDEAQILAETAAPIALAGIVEGPQPQSRADPFRHVWSRFVVVKKVLVLALAPASMRVVLVSFPRGNPSRGPSRRRRGRSAETSEPRGR